MSYKKFFVAIAIFSLFSFSVPQKSHAQWVDVANTPKEYSLDWVATVWGKYALKKLTAQTVNWINSGFKGNPAFVSDPGQFFLDSADAVASSYLSSTALNQLCTPFKAKVRLALVKNYIQESDNYSCTLDTLKDNYDEFMNDFSAGGWDGWFELTQTSGGNPYSAYFAAESQLLKKTAEDKAQKEKELDRGQGFLSYKKCKEGTAMTAEWVTNAWAAGNTDAKVGDCAPENMETVTPGSVINDSLNNALGSGWKQLEAADEINEVVSTLISQLLSTLLDKGLNSLSKSSGGQAAYTTQIIDEPPPEPQYTDSGMELSGTTMNCVPDGNGGQTCTITPGTVTGPDYLSQVDVLTAGLTGGKCMASSDRYAVPLRDAIYSAIDANPDLANQPPTWSNSGDFLSTVESYGGYNITTEVPNGNNNPNKGDLIAIWRDGDTLAERYDVIQDAGSNSGTIEGKIRVGSGEAIPIGCVTGDSSANCRCAMSAPTVTPPTPVTTNPEITSISPVTAKTSQILTINGKNLTTTIQFFDTAGAPYTYTGQGGDTKVTLEIPSGLKPGSYTVKVKSAATISNGKAIEITGATGPAGVEATPGWRGGLVHNPDTNNWLVVSESSNGIYGRIMSNSGSVVSSVFKIDGPATTQALAPKVAYSPEMKKYLVLWYDTPGNLGGTIYGRFVGPTGTVEDLVSVAQDPSKSTMFDANGILGYDSVNKQFVYVWEGSDNIYLRALDTNKVFGNIVTVAEGGTRKFKPAVAVKTDGAEYCVAYDTRETGGVKVKRVDAILGTTGAETAITSSLGQYVSIVYNSVNNKYLVTWQEMENLVLKVKGKILNSCDGTDGGQIFTIKSDWGTAIAAHNPVSNRYAIIGQNQNDFANGYVILGSIGNTIEVGDLFGSGGTTGNFSPVIAPNMSDGTFGQTTSRDHAMTRFLANFGK